MNWATTFDMCYRTSSGITDLELQSFIDSWNLPLSEQELAEIKKQQRNPFHATNPMYELYTPIDPSKWTIPNKRLPAAYIAFLQYSNGGEFGQGERYFQFFNSDELRAMMLAYEFPEYMPGSVPFAMDGCGHHYIWDMREDPARDEYPILVSHSGNLGYDDAMLVATSFVELCQGTVSVEQLLYE